MTSNHDHSPSTAALIFGVLFLLCGLVFLIGSWGAYFTDKHIQINGLSALAHIDKKVFLFDTKGDSDYILQYHFTTTNGAIVESSFGINKKRWQSLNEGDEIEIKYAASNPNRNFPSGAGLRSIGMALYASLFGFIFSLFGGALVMGYFKSKRSSN